MEQHACQAAGARPTPFLRAKTVTMMMRPVPAGEAPGMTQRTVSSQPMRQQLSGCLGSRSPSESQETWPPRGRLAPHPHLTRGHVRVVWPVRIFVGDALVTVDTGFLRCLAIHCVPIAWVVLIGAAVVLLLAVVGLVWRNRIVKEQTMQTLERPEVEVSPRPRSPAILILLVAVLAASQVAKLIEGVTQVLHLGAGT